ncbi:MAG TPA: YoaK family protein [Pyrinomonadaceae bacterium]
MKEKYTTFLLSFVSGFVDTAGFIALGGIFTAHVTGNFVLAGASLVRASTEGVLPKLVMFPIFVAAVGASYLIACRLERSQKNALFYLMILEAVFLFAFAFVGWHFQPESAVKMSETQTIIVGAIGVMAMAIQNAYMKQFLSKLTMTTVMTGNVTQFSIDLTKFTFRVFKSDDAEENAAEIRERLKKVGVAILGFLFGAIGGAVLFVNFGLLAVLLPAGLIVLTAFRAAKPVENHPN